MKIFKYPLVQDPTSLQTVEMPDNALMLHAGEQYGELYVWAMVIPEATKVNYKFFVIGTGENMDHLEMSCKFLNSVQMSNGLVWHIFFKDGE